MKFVLKISVDSPPFGGDPASVQGSEIARVLREAACKWDRTTIAVGARLTLIDADGLPIGQAGILND